METAFKSKMRFRQFAPSKFGSIVTIVRFASIQTMIYDFRSVWLKLNGAKDCFHMQTSFYLLLTVFLVLCVFMSGLILIQRGRGGGLASAFGGAGGNTAFGSKTGDVLTWATAVVFLLFMLMAIGLNVMGEKIHENRVVGSGGTSPVLPSSPTEGPTRAVPTSEAPAATTTQAASSEIVPSDTNALPPETEKPTESLPANSTGDSPTTQP